MTTRTTPCALVIDDDPEMRGLHKRVLTQLGFEVVLTSNATDGIEAVRQFDPTVTFLDVTMPGMDGFAAAARIREFSDTYLLMVSANTDEIDVVQGLAAGADDYICKPFRPRELRARVEAMLRRPRALATAATQTSAPDVDADVWRPGQAAVPASATHTPPLPVGAATARPGGPTVLRRMRLDDGVPVDPAPARGRLHSGLHGVARVRTLGNALARESRAPAEGSFLATSGARLGDAGTVGSPLLEAPPVEAPLPEDPSPRAPTPQLVTGPDGEADRGWVRHGSLALDPARSVALVDGEEVELPPTESALLATLLESGVRVRSTAHLVLALRGESYVTTYYVNEADKSAVKAHMASLQRRLGDTGTTPRWIESVRGVGYRMTAV